MNFKKDYINYLVHTVLYRSDHKLYNNLRLKRIAEKIITAEDVVKMIYIVGKTAGLEMLFKYLLYVSDKIDKSQISIFNLKDNFEYDVRNLEKIFLKIADYRTQEVQEVIGAEETESEQESVSSLNTEPRPQLHDGDKMEIYTDNISEEEESEGLVLIENRDNIQEIEVFELDSITAEENETDDLTENFNNSESIKEEEIPEDTEVDSEPVIEEFMQDVPDVKVEIRKSEDEKVREETVTDEVYYRFETRFFEDVKILEKYFATVSRDCVGENNLNSKSLQCLTEIISITSELSSLARQLSFDLIADIFLTMNIYFTRSISLPSIINSEVIRLFDASLALVNCLIKNENYLNYDSVVEQIEKLKSQLSGSEEPEFHGETKSDTAHYEQQLTENTVTDETEESTVGKSFVPLSAPQKVTEIDSVNFKLRYLVKEFERTFKGIIDAPEVYDRFEALEKINDLNQLLRLIAKISSAMKMNDVLRLAEVTYVFLKYIKDYRMDLLDSEIQQIIKYIIFTFKMLLTNRIPEDFQVLVQYLNNPVKIFTDS